MQENEFEKRVREEMEELRLRPSGMVWDKVEAQLKKRKKRRVIVFIFLLTGFSLLGTSGYFIFNHEKQNLTEQTITTKSDNKNSDNKIENDSGQPTDEFLKKLPAKDQQLKTDDLHNNDEQANTVNENKQPVNELAKTIDEQKNYPDKITAIKEKRSKRPKAQSLKKNNAATIRNTSDDEEILAQQKKVDRTIDKQIAGKDRIADKSEINTDKIDNADKPENNNVKIGTQPDLAEQKQSDIAEADSAIAAAEVKEPAKSVEQKKKKPSSSIKWGIDFSVGSSKIGDNAFSISIFESIFENKSMADVMYNTPGNNAGGQARIITPPSDVKRGTAFKAGIVAEKNISKKSSLSAGLSYAYYSNNIKAGVYRDTSFVLRNMASQAVSLNAYYRGPQQEDYTNHYHFIQLPIYYQLQLNKGVKTPLLWNIGASAGYLLNTNALVYDTATGGIYYRDKDAFSKMHLNINTGFAFRFGNKKLQYSIGPELSMDMRRLMKDATQPKQYFLYGGLTGRVLFTKKK